MTVIAKPSFATAAGSIAIAKPSIAAPKPLIAAPGPSCATSDQELLTVARVFVHDAEAFKTQFLAHSLPDTFIADLTTLIGTFEQTIHDRDAGKDGHTAARARLDSAWASGMRAVHALDVIVENQLHDDPVRMAVWRRDRKVNYPKGAVKEEAEASATEAAESTPAAESAKGATSQG